MNLRYKVNVNKKFQTIFNTTYSLMFSCMIFVRFIPSRHFRQFKPFGPINVSQYYSAIESLDQN